MIKDYNDYELLYLISENEEKAIEIMIEKYQPLIRARANNICYDKLFINEYYQEGLVALMDAIKSFDVKYNKSFTKYFEMILVSRYLNINRKYRGEYHYLKDERYGHDPKIIEETIKQYEQYECRKRLKSKLEITIYNMYFVDNCSIQYIASKTEYTESQIYSAIRRIRKKMIY